MKQKQLISLYLLPKLILLLTGCAILFSCAFQDELLASRTAYYKRPGTTRVTNAEDFFTYTDSLLAPIVRTLQQIETDTPFVETFTQAYGVPLWDNTFLQSDAEGVNFYVPLYDSRSPQLIQAVWIFCIADDKMTYAPIRRPETTDINEQTFLFDLLSYLTFGADNATGQIFRPHAQTREWVVVTECWDAYAGGEEVQEYKYTVCVDKTVWRETIDDFLTNEGGGGGGGGSGNEVPIVPGGGGGSNGDNPNDSSKVEKAKSIFSNNVLPMKYWEKLDSCLTEIDSTCMGEALHNKIKEILQDKRIKVGIVKEGSHSYNYSNNTLKFNINNPESDALMHELWHFCQYHQNTALLFNSKKMNMEVEARYAQYLFMKETGKWDSLYKDIFINMPSWLAISNLKDHIDNKGQLLPGQIEMFFDAYIEGTVVPAICRTDSDYKKYPFEPEEGTNAFSLIQELTKNCD